MGKTIFVKTAKAGSAPKEKPVAIGNNMSCAKARNEADILNTASRLRANGSFIEPITDREKACLVYGCVLGLAIAAKDEGLFEDMTEPEVASFYLAMLNGDFHG